MLAADYLSEKYHRRGGMRRSGDIEQLVAAYRTRLDLVHLFGEFFFAINLSAFFAGEIAQADDRI